MIVGSTGVVGKLLANSLPIFLSNGLSVIIASFIYIIILKIKKIDLSILSKKDYFVLFLIAFFGTFLYRILFFYGLKFTSASEAGIVSSTLPAVFAITSSILLKEKIKSNQIKGIIFSIIGIFLINYNDGIILTGLFSKIFGNFLIFLSVIMGALFSVLSKFLSKKVTPIMISSISTFFSALLLLPLLVYDGFHFNFLLLTSTGLLLILYYGVFVSVISFLLWFNGLTVIPLSTAGVLTSLIPITGVLLSFIVLKETLSFYQIIGAISILISIFTISKENRPN
jgi:drug/metabolite transporter (DMT)-like permease